MTIERKFGASEVLISTTDTDSRIKHANESFCKIAGYSLDELKGSPHNKVRHPDMPKAAFKDLWATIQKGKSWMGPVKNLCKNGDYYWVNAFVTPIKDKSGKIYEYQSVRTNPDSAVIDRANSVYPQLCNNKTPRAAKNKTDKTLWTQVILFMVTLLSIVNVILASGSFITSVPICVLSLLGSVIFYSWRTHYKVAVREAKSIFDNPLMSYLYSGNNDDIGSILLSMKMRSAEINAVVGRVSDDSTVITDSAQISADRGTSVATILQKQTVETEQIATAINQMSATVQDIARVVSDAAQASQQGLDISNEGQNIVTQTTSSIVELSDQLGEVDEAINRLIEGTQSIENVLGEISGIADQTNLLALNAAIEAARAGEQGRGFAVVADEVRSLAMRSQQSTEEISKLIQQLRNESDFAINAMTKGNDLSSRCVGLASETGESLREVNMKVSALADLNIQISTAVEEQSVVAEQVNKSISSISATSSESERHGREAVTFAETLLDRLHAQQNLISQFRV